MGDYGGKLCGRHWGLDRTQGNDLGIGGWACLYTRHIGLNVHLPCPTNLFDSAFDVRVGVAIDMS